MYNADACSLLGLLGFDWNAYVILHLCDYGVKGFQVQSFIRVVAGSATRRGVDVDGRHTRRFYLLQSPLSAATSRHISILQRMWEQLQLYGCISPKTDP